MKLFVNGKEWVTKDDYEGNGSPRVYQKSPSEPHMFRFWGPLRRAPKRVMVAVEFGYRCKGPRVSTVMTWKPWQRFQWFELPSPPRITDRQGLEWVFSYQNSGRVQWATLPNIEGASGGPFLGFRLSLSEMLSGYMSVRLAGSSLARVPAELPILDAIDTAKELAISEMEKRCKESQIVRPSNASRFECIEK